MIQQQPRQPAPPPPAVGTVENGYRFRGGDPAQESSWEQVEPIDVSDQYGAGARQLPNGVIERVGPRGGVERIGSATGADGQASALVGADARARFMINAGPLESAQRTLNQMDADGYRVGRDDWGAVLAESIPFDGGAIARLIGGDDYTSFQQANKTYEAALLPIMSGAAVTPTEAERLIRANLPQIGDTDEVRRRKSQQRDQQVNAVFEGIGMDGPFDTRPLVGPTTDNGLPSYPRIEALTANAQEFPIPERQAAPVVDLQTASRDEIIAALRAGGTFRDGLDGQPYSLPPQEPQFGPAQEGDRMAQPGVVVRPQPGFMATPMAGPIRGALGVINGPVGAFAQAFNERVPGADEAAQGLAGLISRRGYAAASDTADRLAQEDREQRPLARNLGGIAGTIAPLAAPGFTGGSWIANAPNLGYAMTRSAAVAAPWSAAMAAGDAEGGIAERASAGARGFGEGLLFGLAAPPVARGVGAVVGPLAQPVTDLFSDLAARVGGVPVTQADSAVRTLTRGASLDDLEGQLARMRSFGAEPTFADIGGSNVQSRVRVAATRQTPGRQVAEDFAAGRRGEVQDYAANLAQRISQRDATPEQMTDALEQYQRNASRPAFDAVRGDRIQLDDQSVMALRGRQGRNAIREAAEAFGSSVDENERLVAAELNRLADDILDQPNVQISVGAADLISRYLNRAGGTDQNLQRIFSGAGRAVRDNARKQSPGYDEALRGFAERARLGDAVEVGERFVGNRGYAGDFVAGVNAMSEPEREIAAAAARAAVERAAGTPAGAARVLDNLAIARDQARRTEALLGAGGAQQIQEGAQVGRQLVAAGQNVSPRVGSSSFLNISDNAQETGGAMLNLLRGRPVSAAFDFIRSRGMSDQEAEQIVRLALDPSRTDEVLAILRTRFPEGESLQIVEQLTPILAGQIGSSQAQRQPRLVGPEP